MGTTISKSAAKSKKLGLLKSSPASARDGKLSDEIVELLNAPEEVLLYDPQDSYMVSFGIDQQYSNTGQQIRSLGDAIKLTSLDVTLSFTESNIIPQDRFKVFVSSEEKEECSLVGMTKEIKKSAGQVKSNGILIIFLSGIGVRHRYGPGDDHWGFAPDDYDRDDPGSLLTASGLISCLHEAQCKAKYILIILDCCYSGSMAKELTGANASTTDPSSLLPHTYVLAATSANDTSLAINSLGYSIFSYFLRFAIDKVQQSPGVLPLVDIFEECQLCCEAFSSLIIRYDKKLGLTFGRFRPSMAAYDPQSALDNVVLPDEQSAAVPHEGKTAFVFKYFQPRKDKTKPSPQLHALTCDWLESLTKLDPNPLMVLEERDLFDSGFDFEGRVLTAVITLLIHSVASIEVVHDNINITNPNLFLIAFVEVMATLNRAQHNIKITPQHLLNSLPYYVNALAKRELDCSELVVLYEKLISDVSSAQLDAVQVRIKIMHDASCCSYQ